MERHDTLLVACGTAENRKTLCSILDEHYNLLQASNVQQMLLLLEQNSGCIAAVLLDATGFDHKNKALFEQPEIQMLLKNKPVIVIVQDESPEVCNLVFRYGVTDVIPLHYDPYAMLRRIENIVELNVHKNHLEVLVEEQAAILRHSNDTMVDALSSIIEYRSVESGQHILRIRHFTKILLEEVVRSCPEYKLTEADVQIISSAAALHDVGKISIPDAILKKPGKLTEEEMEIMRGHTLTGCHILQRLGDLGNKEYMRYAHNICHYHHERWDGNGYPEGLSGEAIPICAQVVGLADVYDALTTKRVYKDAYSFDTAVNMILNGECGVFSPKLLECFKHVTSQYEALARAYADGLSPATETFDTILSPAEETRTDDSIERTWAKYQALVHYCNVFLLELDLGQGLFHLIYNPYPELIDFHDVSTLGELRQKVLQQLVHPTQKQKLEQLLNDDLNSFLQQGLRRANYRFRFCSAEYPQGEWFELTLLRINPTDKQRKSLAVLCRKLEQQADADAGRLNVESESISLADSSYCCVYDDDFTLVRLEGRPGQLMGYTAKELNETFGNRLIELVVPEDRAQVRREIRRQLGMGNDFRLEYRMRHKNGTVVWVLEKSHLWAGADGKEYLSSNLFDISSTKETVERLNRKLDRYEIILAQTENVLFEWDIPTDHVEFSETWEKLFGFDPVSGSADTALRNGSFFHPDDLPRLLDRIRDLRSGSTYEMAEVRVITAKGRYLWCRFRASAIRDEAGNLIKIVGIIINIDADKQAERALQHRAERDSLTGLLNKQAGIQQAEEYLAQYAHGTNCAVLIIDLDDFKLVNDRYGHLFGDEVLARTAKEIKKLFRNQDIIARIGGDEFMVVMRGVSSRALIESRCRQMLASLCGMFPQYEDFPLGCSIGVALAPEHGTGYYELFQHADQALYRAKRQGKNTFVFYDAKQAALVLQQDATAVSKKIDSDEQPGLADSGIVHYAFQKLYTATDATEAINEILAMIGRQLNVSRVYIFENSPDNCFCSNTYEWCNEGIPPEIENLQNISYQQDIPGYRENFDDKDILYCSDIAQLPRPVYDILAPQGIKSMLHCAIRENGIFRGYIGFDECRRHHLWTSEQIRLLTYFSEMLSVFLLKNQRQTAALQQIEELRGILDRQAGWSYVIDPQTFTLKYLNAGAQALARQAQPGQCCYQALYGRETPCNGCPAVQNAARPTSVLMDGGRILADSAPVQWEGTAACLLSCRELPGCDR